MKGLTIEALARVTGGVCRGPAVTEQKEISAISTDSRRIESGSLYVPVVGARVDGHTFIDDVMKKGALVTLSEQELGETDYPWIRVESTLQAVKDIAEFYLKEVGIPVVGISGSVGKTSTKEMIGAILDVKFRVLKTAGNFNNELGLPLTVFRIREGDEIAVLEMGISDFGEMTRLARIARPDVAVITNIGWCHLENLKTRDGILKAKTEMLYWVKEGGSIILNGDDDKLSTVEPVRGIAPVFFGLDSSFPVWADEIEGLGLKGIRCRIHAGETSVVVTIPLPGQHMVYNALAGTCVGLRFGMTLAEICQGIESLQSLGGRFNILERNGRVVVDDCYNANPVSMKSSLKVLEDGLGRKVAVLGDMGELGRDEQALHDEVGDYAGTLKLDVLYTIGELTRGLSAHAGAANPNLVTEHFSTVEDFLAVCDSRILAGDTVLVKASHFMGFERIVEAL